MLILQGVTSGHEGGFHLVFASDLPRFRDLPEYPLPATNLAIGASSVDALVGISSIFLNAVSARIFAYLIALEKEAFQTCSKTQLVINSLLSVFSRLASDSILMICSFDNPSSR